MKKLRYIIPVIALFLFACDSDDDGFYNTVYVQANELMDIETQDVYAINDVFFVNAHVPKLLDEPGFPTLLNVRETTGNAPSFDFIYALEKKNANGDWELFDVTNDYVAGGEGDANVDFAVQGILLYDDAAEEYQYRGGIRLTQTGEYRFNFSNQTENYNKVVLRSQSINNNITLNIFSTSTDLDASGYHLFTVTN